MWRWSELSFVGKHNFLSKNPNDCVVNTLRTHSLMAIQLNSLQLAGGCKIYVPDGLIDAYVDAWSYYSDGYRAIMFNLNELDESIKVYIE